MSRTPIDQNDECRDAIRAEIELRDKSFATLRAQLALVGFTLQILSDPSTGGTAYLVSKWNYFHELPDWASLVEWAGRAGVQS